ncbi:hypothetical protein NKH77_49190 [Streptomyces sp. M19]
MQPGEGLGVDLAVELSDSSTMIRSIARESMPISASIDVSTYGVLACSLSTRSVRSPAVSGSSAAGPSLSSGQ